MLFRSARPRPKGPKHKHHIVAKAASNPHAVSSRNLLKRFKIGINSSRNLVLIHRNVHSVMHTKRYYRGVCTFLKQKPINRVNVLNRLAKLKTAIKGIDLAINPT